MPFPFFFIPQKTTEEGGKRSRGIENDPFPLCLRAEFSAPFSFPSFIGLLPSTCTKPALGSSFFFSFSHSCGPARAPLPFSLGRRKERKSERLFPFFSVFLLESRVALFPFSSHHVKSKGAKSLLFFPPPTPGSTFSPLPFSARAYRPKR